jgi:hypothetical protein
MDRGVRTVPRSSSRLGPKERKAVMRYEDHRLQKGGYTYVTLVVVDYSLVDESRATARSKC